jgi:hypothetical protein
MTFGLIKNTSECNKGEDINNDLRDVSCHRRRHLWIHPNNNLFVITKNNYLKKLQCVLKKDNFVCKFVKEKTIYQNILLIEINSKKCNIYIS